MPLVLPRGPLRKACNRIPKMFASRATSQFVEVQRLVAFCESRFGKRFQFRKSLFGCDDAFPRLVVSFGEEEFREMDDFGLFLGGQLLANLNEFFNQATHGCFITGFRKLLKPVLS